MKRQDQFLAAVGLFSMLFFVGTCYGEHPAEHPTATKQATEHPSAAQKADAACSHHKEQNATLTQAANELRGSNPDLASKLDTLVKECCGKAHS